MSPRVAPRRRELDESSSYGEFRSRAASGQQNFGPSLDSTFWRYMTAPPNALKGPDDHDVANFLFEPNEQRVLSKATNPAGGFVVPTDFDDMITSARRARNVIANVSRILETEHGRSVPIPSASAHGSGSWTSENAAYVASDDTFAQVTLGAFKASTKSIVSEELAQDALGNFDVYLSEELGLRLALLEESAFAVGDGIGKPMGLAHASSGIATVTAAVGSSTTFTLADFRSAFAALPAAYAASATWVMSPSAFTNAAARLDSAGAPAMPSLHTSEPSLFSRPVLIANEFPAAGASARSVVLGDFHAGYTVRRVVGLGLHRQVELHSDNGQVGYRMFSRLDARVVLADALRVLAHSAT